MIGKVTANQIFGACNLQKTEQFIIEMKSHMDRTYIDTGNHQLFCPAWEGNSLTQYDE